VQIDVHEAAVSFGPVQIFENFTAAFLPNTVTALVGPSGSGKSTLLSAMSGFTNLTKGEITFLSLAGKPQAADPSMVAWVPQASNALSARSVIDNVTIGPLSEGVSVRQATSIALECLADVGIGSLAHNRVRVISGGERQRLGFARALASLKPIIFADEPSASLDEANTLLLAALLTRLRARATIVVATHDPILAAAAEHTVHMRGRVSVST
jgi:putative ABC transport system ATP-binding protein